MDKVREKLGTTTNMLYGYNPSWLSEPAGNNALFPVPDPALEEIEIKSLGDTGRTWSYPYVSLHDTPESLLDSLLPYQVKNPSGGPQAALFPAGTLLIGDLDRDTAIQKLSETLGVNLSNSNFGYALIQLKRVDGIDTHPSNQRGMLVYPNPANIPDELGVKPQFRRTMASFKRMKSPTFFSPDDIEVLDANKCLQCFAQHGTHFISGVTLGDTIFQVYAMPRDRYKIVKERTSSLDLSGSSETLSFKQFTKSSSGDYGYVEEYGEILSFSQSDVLSQAVAADQWFESTFAKANSIFAAFDTSAEIDISILNRDYTDVTVVMRDLTSLTLFAEYSRSKIWTRVFKGGLIQKYKGVVQPKFVPYYHEKDLSKDLQQDQLEGFLSYIATPVINTYKPSLNLSDLDFVFPEEVQKFTLYGNYLYSSQSKTITIPGKDVLICGQLFPLETEDYTTTIEVNDDALQNLSFSCQKFYGALLVQNASNTEYFTFVDGLKYINTEAGLHGRYYVQVTDDVRNPPASDQLERLKSSLRFSYSFSEAAINSLEAECSPTLYNCSNFDLKLFLIQSLVWITEIVPKDTTDVDLLDLRVGALDLIHIGQDRSLGAFVPILPVDRYQQYLDSILEFIDTIEAEIKTYQEQIRARKALELVISGLNVLNENIIESGELLAGYVNANIEQLKSLSGYYSSIIAEKEREKQETEATITELDGQLFQQRAEVETAVENYKQALTDWQRRANIKFALEVATLIFKVGTLMKTPDGLVDTAKQLGSTTEAVQNFLNIVDIFNGIYVTSGSASDLQEAQNAFDDVSEISNLELDILNAQMSSVLLLAPNDPKVQRAKINLLAAFQTLVLKGKAFTDAQSKRQQIGREIYNQQRQQNLIEDQIGRLESLDTDLHPENIEDLEKQKIDLIGLTGSLSLVRSQTLALFSKALTEKDQVLRYTYLQSPTPISSFDTLGIKKALMEQEGKSVSAEEALSQIQPSRTIPIEIPVEIPTSDLVNGGVCQFKLSSDRGEFSQYVNLRVDSVVAKIEGVKSTDTGEYLLKLAYQGKPFYDRGLEYESLTFNTLHRERTYEYKVEGNEPQFTDEGESWSNNVNPITPFSTWEISLPQGQTNQGLRFTGLIAKVTLTFVVNVRISDRLASEFSLVAPALAMGSRPSADDLIAKMYDKSILKGWDVVFNMSLDRINRVLELQYEELKENTDYGGKIKTEGEFIKEHTQPIPQDIWDYLKIDFDVEYGYPKLDFLAGSEDKTKLEMKMIGTMQQTRRQESSNPDDEPFIQMMADKYQVPLQTGENNNNERIWYYEAPLEPVDLGDQAILTASIEISQVQGLVNSNNNILSVVLDMAQGTFMAENMDIDVHWDNSNQIQFSQDVQAYFQNNPVQFIINSLDLTNIATLKDLKPNEFKFKAVKEKEILQLYILTNDRTIAQEQLETSLVISENPIPEGSECSLMINSRIFFGSVLPESLVTGSGWKLQAEDPQDIDSAWSAAFTQISVQGDVDLSPLDQPAGLFDSMDGSFTTSTYKPEKGNPVTFSLEGMRFQTKDDRSGKIEIYYEDQQKFEYEQCQTLHILFLPVKTHCKGLDTNIELNINSEVPITILGSNREQEIKIEVTNELVAIDARTGGGGACGCDDLDAQVNQQLKEELPPQITPNLSDIKFNSVSIFALKNLLFASKNYIDLQKVHVPGDLLILGNFLIDES